MKYILFLILGIVVGAGGYAGISKFQVTGKQDTKNDVVIEKPKPLLKYTIENLAKRNYQSEIILDGIAASNAAFFVQKFHFDSDGKSVTGLVHTPIGDGPFPVVVQFRGYADIENYYPGYGTEHSAEKYTKAGYMTIAPDFLGYGESASPSADVWEARFETYTTAVNLLNAVEIWNKGNGKIGIWGHSNGGQIALAALEITGKQYPTTLWAPQSLPFPYSIMYYTDENGDGDRDLRLSLAEFEKDYDYKLFNPLGYLDRIQAPIQLHHGTADEAILIKWADKLAKELNAKYFVYPGADHNFLPIANWNKVIERDIDFFSREMVK